MFVFVFLFVSEPVPLLLVFFCLKILSGSAKVGFTTAPDWVCYSPCKNNTADAAASVAAGVPAGCAFTAESDQYFLFAELLRRLGADIPSAPKRSILGITA
jgi:hypothetical protein